MPHDVTLIATIAGAFVLAFVFGVIANGLRLSPLVGYLVAGIAIGPFTPGFYVADSAMASQLAEIGVMLLMFGVGLHFSVADLLAVRRIAIPGAVCQIVIATALGAFAAMKFWGWSLGGGLVLGLSLSVASTVVMLRALEERNAVKSTNGRIAIGWLVVEDLAMVLVLVLLPAVAEMLGGHAAAGAHAPGGSGVAMALVITLAKVTAFVVIAMMAGPKVLPWLLRQVARTGSRELFTLATLTVSLGLAFAAAKLFDVSFALGAFFAGMVLSESELSHKAAENSLPLQDAFAVLFFVSVGMLFDPSIIVREPMMVLTVLGLILVGKSVVALGIVMLLGYPLSTGLMVAASLAQVGEFSFILAGLGATYGLLPKEGLSLVLAGAILSIALSPLVFALVDLLMGGIKARPKLAHRLEALRGKRIARLQLDLDTAKAIAVKKAEAHKTFGPQELAERFPLFAGLTPDQREVLALHFESRSARPGEKIIRSGDKADSVYFISSGQVEIPVAGKRIKLGPGGFFGEMALLTGQLRSADVITLDYCEFLTLSQRDFRTIGRRYPEIRVQIAATAAARGEMNRQLFEEAAHSSTPGF